MGSVQTGFTLRTPLRLLERWFLGRDAAAPVVRFALLWGSFGLYWVILVVVAGLQASPLPGWLDWLPFPFDLLVQTASMFFAPRVLIGLLPVALGLWLGFRVAADYLADLYDLEKPAIASRYLWPSLFGLDYVSYPRLDVATGDLDLMDQDNPLSAIGGPGYLRIHLGHGAVFEGIDGRPKVYGPTQLQFIQGFERLRDVIDLRDQAARVDVVRAMTRDGIEVFARDAQMVFRVYRGRGRQRTLEDPYPYDEASARRLVYAQPVNEQGRSRWTESLPERVRREIQRFVSELTLEEFLALRPQPFSADAAGAFHIPREALTSRFHTPEAIARLKEAGLELDWVGVGTWEVRDPLSKSEGALSVSQALITGWREKERLELYTSPEYLERQHARGYREYASGLLTEIVEAWKGDGGGQDPQAACLQVLTQMHGRLTRMHEEIENDPQARPPLELEQAIRHIETLVSPHWLGGGPQ